MRKEEVRGGVDGIERALRLTTKKTTSMGNVHLYNENVNIKKYNSTDDIFNEFYLARYRLYQERRLFQLDALQKTMRLISERVRFILEMIEGTIDLRKKKASVVDEMLEAKNYPRLGANANYDYLVKLPLQSLTEEKVDELTKERDDLQRELEVLQNTSEEQMWLNEIEEFAVAYKKRKKKTTKKKTVKRVTSRK